MTTARSSWRSSLALAAILVCAGARASAHRLDEYLQATRILVEPARLQITLDLTAGVSVAAAILGDLDRDRDGSLGADETRAYAARVLSALSVAVDDRPLAVEITDARFPTVNEIRKGEGTIRVEMTAAMTGLAPGEHRVRYRNLHHPENAAYLANAMMPESRQVAITEQRRDFTQRELTIRYDLGPSETRRVLRWVIAIAGLVLSSATLAWRFRASRSRDTRVSSSDNR